MTVYILLGYIVLLLSLGLFSTRLLKKTLGDFFLASRGIGPFMLLMSIFGTTMTAFALVGSTGRTFSKGIGVYGLMASWSGIIHSACFFLIGARVWSLGKRHGYLTQISFFRDRYRSDAVALLLFPVMVLFVLIYILMGVLGSGKVIEGLTPETFSREGVRTEIPLESPPRGLAIPDSWKDRLVVDSREGKLVLHGSLAPRRKKEFLAMVPSADPAWREAVNQLFSKAPRGGIPYWAGSGFICLVVLLYVFFGGMRATAWANTFQTLVFMVMGILAFAVITWQLGGPVAATQRLLDPGNPNLAESMKRLVREGNIGKLQFLTYCFIPLSVGMFPHLFQHWLTAKRGSSFKLTVVAHPICILVTWVPCVLIGMWAAGKGVLPLATEENKVLALMVNKYAGEVLGGLIGAGILAAIMSSMDSQFLCLGSMFTNDIAVEYFGKDRFSERQRVYLGRAFVASIVLITYLIGLSLSQDKIASRVFSLGVWCFTGFASLFPLAFAAVYWKRSNKYGALATILTVAFLWLYFLPRVLRDSEAFLILGMMPVTVIIAASIVALVSVTLMTPRPDRKLVERFFGTS